jgi:hypothetical protein
MRVEYSQRIDGLYNKWEKFHPSILRESVPDQYPMTAIEHTPFVWVVTQVVDNLPKE